MIVIGLLIGLAIGVSIGFVIGRAFQPKDEPPIIEPNGQPSDFIAFREARQRRRERAESRFRGE